MYENEFSLQHIVEERSMCIRWTLRQACSIHPAAAATAARTTMNAIISQ